MIEWSVQKLVFLMVLGPIAISGHKLKFLSLNNGGKIMSLITDNIILRVTTIRMKEVIRCPKGIQNMQFKPGSIHKFKNLWIDSGYVDIQIQQLNIFSKSDSATIRYSFEGSQTGIYMSTLLLSDFSTNVAIGFKYMGVGDNIQFQQQRQAAYYLFLQLTDDQVQTNSYGFDESQCRLFWEKIQVKIYILAFIIVLFMVNQY